MEELLHVYPLNVDKLNECTNVGNLLTKVRNKNPLNNNLSFMLEFLKHKASIARLLAYDPCIKGGGGGDSSHQKLINFLIDRCL